MATPKIKKTKKQRPTPRRKLVSLRVYCLSEERMIIEGNAKATGKSLSEYLRSVGMGVRIKTVLDQQAIRELIKINADQGRLGGLLKALLTNDERLDGYTGVQLQNITLSTLRDIQAVQTQLFNFVSKFVGKG